MQNVPLLGHFALHLGNEFSLSDNYLSRSNNQGKNIIQAARSPSTTETIEIVQYGCSFTLNIPIEPRPISPKNIQPMSDGMPSITINTTDPIAAAKGSPYDPAICVRYSVYSKTAITKMLRIVSFFLSVINNGYFQNYIPDGNSFDNIVTRSNSAEDGVVLRKGFVIFKHYEKLRAVGVGTRIGHG